MSNKTKLVINVPKLRFSKNIISGILEDSLRDTGFSVQTVVEDGTAVCVIGEHTIERDIYCLDDLFTAFDGYNAVDLTFMQSSKEIVATIKDEAFWQ